jgi:hypothetical protein
LTALSEMESGFIIAVPLPDPQVQGPPHSAVGLSVWSVRTAINGRAGDDTPQSDRPGPVLLHDDAQGSGDGRGIIEPRPDRSNALSETCIHTSDRRADEAPGKTLWSTELRGRYAQAAVTSQLRIPSLTPSHKIRPVFSTTYTAG